MILMLKNYFWRENGRVRHFDAKGSGASKPDQKVGPPGGTFGSTIVSKMFSKIKGLTHPPPLKCRFILAIPSHGYTLYHSIPGQSYKRFCSTHFRKIANWEKCSFMVFWRFLTIETSFQDILSWNNFSSPLNLKGNV